jgi:hypothetical protein
VIKNVQIIEVAISRNPVSVGKKLNYPLNYPRIKTQDKNPG